MRSAMKSGELDEEPETTLGKHDATHPSFDNSAADEEDDKDDVAADGKPLTSPETSSKAKSETKLKAKKTKGGTAKPQPPPAAANLTLEGDDFFGSD